MNIDAAVGLKYAQAFLQSSLASGRNASGTDSASADFSLEAVAEVEEVVQPTVEDVKKEFAAFLSSLRITQVGTAISVSVSDAAWEKMAADPEYKQKMMDLCKRDLCDPAWGTKVPCPAVTTIRIDADCEEEYLASGYGSAVADKADTGDSFWTKRAKRHRAALEDMEERALERRQMMEFVQERMAQREEGLGGRGFVSQLGAYYFPAAAGGAAGIFGLTV